MKKKNFLWSMFAIMMVTMLSVSLSACSSDDDANNNNGVVGTWIQVDVDGGDRHTYSITFKSNGTGTFSELHEHQGEEPYTESAPFTYTPVSDTEGTIAEEEEDSYGSGKSTYYYRYVVIGNKLRLYEGNDNYYEEYTRK